MSLPTILVVDDSRWVAGVLDSLFGPLGYRVVYAPNGAAALAAARTARPDIVIADVRRRVLKFIGFIRELRHDPDLGRIPVILWSAVYQPYEIKSLADGCQPITAWNKIDDRDGLCSLVENLTR